jgi:hypothetical protein
VTYFLIVLGVIIACLGGLAYWEHHENSILTGQIATYQADLATAQSINADNAVQLAKLKMDADEAGKIVASVDEKQLEDQKNTNTIIQKVHDAPKSSCVAMPNAILVAVSGVYQQHTNHAGTAKRN